MNDREAGKPETALFSTLQERAKELSCLYKVEEILSNFRLSLDEVFRRVIKVIPPGWQFPELCQARIVYGADVYASPDFEETPYIQSADIRVHETVVGRIFISYRKPTAEADSGPFLTGESQAHPDDRRAPGPLHPPSEAAADVRGDERGAPQRRPRPRRAGGLPWTCSATPTRIFSSASPAR